MWTRAHLTLSALMATASPPPIDCKSNPPPMAVAEWQRLVDVMRARAKEKARGSSFPLSKIETLVPAAEACRVEFWPNSRGVRGNLLVTKLMTEDSSLWLGARLQERHGRWVFLGFEWGSVD